MKKFFQHNGIAFHFKEKGAAGIPILFLHGLGADSSQSMEFLNGLEELKVLKRPSLVLANDRDPLHPLDFGLQMAANLPQSRFYTLPPKYFEPELHRVEALGQIGCWMKDLEGWF